MNALAYLEGIRWLKLLRRVHLYAGLVLLPWSLFFGVSGVLFNHPNLGEKLSSSFVPPPRLQALTGLTPWDAGVVAREVVAGLNANAGRVAYSIDPEFVSRIEGVMILKAPAVEGQHIVLYSPERGLGVVATRYARLDGEPAPFATPKLELPSYSSAFVQEKVRPLLAATGRRSAGTLYADPKLQPKLELRLRDERGTPWNVTYSLGSGAVAGRRLDQAPNLGVSQLLTMLHTTHHFPMRVRARWFWAFFQDALGVTMVFWSLSGLAMWWQLKATRIAGAVSLLVAVGMAAAVVKGTADELLFGDVAQQLGPGE